MCQLRLLSDAVLPRSLRIAGGVLSGMAAAGLWWRRGLAWRAFFPSAIPCAVDEGEDSFG